MDSTSKAKSWYGSLYGFECSHDVDGFMNKDTAIYLENQVQNVGESVKRLYSSMKNMLPPLKEDRVKSEAGFDKEQLSLDDTLENAMASSTFDDNKSQPIEPSRVDACQDSNTCVVREDQKHAMRNVDVDLVGLASSDAEIFSLPSEKEDISFNTSSTSGWEFEDNLSTFEDPKSNEDNIPSSPQVTFADNVHQDNSSISDTPISSDLVRTKRISKEKSTLCDNEDGAIGHILTSCSTFPKSSNVFNSSSANYTCPESIQSSVVNLNDCSYDSFTSSSATLYHRTKAIGSPPVIPIERSKDQIDTDDDVMETIDLSSDAKPVQRPTVADSNSSYVASYRKKNFSYYKKLIKNALTSHKRLAKEYKHLPILHGDINTDLLRSSDPHSTRTQSSTENEWELL